MRSDKRTLAGLYMTIVLLAAIYVLATEIYLRHQQVEHLLPTFLLALVTLPLSLTGELLYPVAPFLFDGAFVQIAFFTLCGAVQASVLWWWLNRRSHAQQ